MLEIPFIVNFLYIGVPVIIIAASIVLIRLDKKVGEEE